MKLTKKKELLTVEDILSKVSEFSIYRYYINSDIKLGVAFCSVFRKDNNPSMAIYLGQDGRLHHTDFADDRYKGSCIDLVCQMYNLSFPEALEKIGGDMGIANNSKEYKRIVKDHVQPILDRRKHSFIQITYKKYSQRELDWWAQFGITLPQLQADNVFSVKDLYLNRKKLHIDKGEMVYGYYYPEGMKIYFPERERDDKWLSSITTKVVEGLHELEGRDRVVIAKSKKDRLVLRNILPSYIAVISTQNESISAFTDELIGKLNGKNCWIAFDTDPAGKAASRRVNDKCPHWKHINVPDWFYENMMIKDWAELYSELGAEVIVKHFKDKGVII